MLYHLVSEAARPAFSVAAWKMFSLSEADIVGAPVHSSRQPLLAQSKTKHSRGGDGDEDWNGNEDGMGGLVIIIIHNTVASPTSSRPLFPFKQILNHIYAYALVWVTWNSAQHF